LFLFWEQYAGAKMIVMAPARSLLIVVIVATTAILAVALCQQSHEVTVSAESRIDQGCVNHGNDRREFAPVICWLQQRLSWKSEHEPHFVLIGNPKGTQLGLAWPPYVVFNSPDGRGHWRMFRIGFRYDRTWRGYIFPTIALKRISQPLRY
jgi:hypothetical protein